MTLTIAIGDPPDGRYGTGENEWRGLGHVRGPHPLCISLEPLLTGADGVHQEPRAGLIKHDAVIEFFNEVLAIAEKKN